MGRDRGGQVLEDLSRPELLTQLTSQEPHPE
jgi:hypothetical protein